MKASLKCVVVVVAPDGDKQRVVGDGPIGGKLLRSVVSLITPFFAG